MIKREFTRAQWGQQIDAGGWHFASFRHWSCAMQTESTLSLGDCIITRYQHIEKNETISKTILNFWIQEYKTGDSILEDDGSITTNPKETLVDELLGREEPQQKNMK